MHFESMKEPTPLMKNEKNSWQRFAAASRLQIQYIKGLKNAVYGYCLDTGWITDSILMPWLSEVINKLLPESKIIFNPTSEDFLRIPGYRLPKIKFDIGDVIIYKQKPTAVIKLMIDYPNKEIAYQIETGQIVKSRYAKSPEEYYSKFGMKPINQQKGFIVLKKVKRV